MTVFLDTSAFVKRYIEESGSGRVLEIGHAADRMILSVICLPEIISTLNRLLRERKLTGSQYHELKHIILDDLEGIEICGLTPEVLLRTMNCLERYPLRAMDAIHLGCALAVEADLFVSADKRQTEAARREGLEVELLG